MSKKHSKEEAKVAREKHLAYMRKYHYDHLDYHRARMRAYRRKKVREIEGYDKLCRHKLTEEQYKGYKKKQHGLCACCKTRPVAKTKHSLDGFTVDHDHRCCAGQLSCGNCTRGLLCSRCNMGLGNFSDSVKLLRKAIQYLKKWEAKRAGGRRTHK